MSPSPSGSTVPQPSSRSRIPNLRGWTMFFVTFHETVPNVYAYDDDGNLHNPSAPDVLDASGQSLEELRGLYLDQSSGLLYVANGAAKTSNVLCFKGSGTSYKYVSTFIESASAKGPKSATTGTCAGVRRREDIATCRTRTPTWSPPSTSPPMASPPRRLFTSRPTWRAWDLLASSSRGRWWPRGRRRSARCGEGDEGPAARRDNRAGRARRRTTERQGAKLGPRRVLQCGSALRRR